MHTYRQLWLTSDSWNLTATSLHVCYLARILNVTVCVLKECTKKVAVWQAKNSLHNILQGDTCWQTKMQCLISLANQSSLQLEMWVL